MHSMRRLTASAWWHAGANTTRRLKPGERDGVLPTQTTGTTPQGRGGMETKKDDDTESRGGCTVCQPRETIPKSERMELKAFALKSFGFGVVKVSFSIWHLE